MAKKPQVYLSYQHASGKELAAQLHDHLEALGAEVFYDHELLAGVDWRQELRRNILACDFFVVLLAPSSLNNPEGVLWELRIAYERSKPIIPVYLPGFSSDELPDEIAELGSRTHITYDGSNFERLAKQIERAFGLEGSQRPTGKSAAKDEPKERERPSIQVILAVIALLGTLGAALIGVLPDLIDRLRPTPTPTETPTPDLPGTPTQIAQLDTTATEAMLQRTVDARSTENALLLAQNTQIAAETQTASVPTATDTATATDTPTHTATATETPTVTNTPTLTPAVTSTPTFPCQGTIIFRSGGLSQVKVSPLQNAPNTTPVQQGSIVQILMARNSDGDEWYQIKYADNTGWITTDLVQPHDSCPQ